MKSSYKINFSELTWESPIPGMRHKYRDIDGRRYRLVEYSRDMAPHWCEKGHYGYLISGRMAIEFDDYEETYNESDCIILPDGTEYRHKGRILSEKALVFFIE